MRLLKRSLMLLLSFAPFCTAQQLVPHSWPDTVVSMGCANVSSLFRFMEASSPITSGLKPCGTGNTDTLTVSGAATYQQPGYDPTTPLTNGSLQLGVGGKAIANSSATGDLSFRHAGGFEVLIPNLNLSSPASGSAYSLIGKGVSLSSFNSLFNGSSAGYVLYLFNNSGSPFFYLFLSGSASSEAAGGGQTACEIYYSAYAGGAAGSAIVTEGKSYDITVSWPGDGNCANISFAINGAGATGNLATSNTGSFSGIYKTTLSSGGTGYLSGGSGTFAVTYTGTCTTPPTGLANVTSGVVTSVTNSSSYQFGFGCTGAAPVPVFTAGGGTGAAGVGVYNVGDTTNSGFLTVGDFNSTAWATGSTVSYAGFASFPNGITPTEVAQHFVATDYYRHLLPAKPATPTLVVVSNDFCSDTDGPQQLWVTERLAQLGYYTIIGAVSTEAAVSGPQYLQYSLARAGMSGVPVMQTTVSASTDEGYCAPAVTAVTAAQAIARTSYPSPIAALRQALVNSPNGSVVFFDGGSPTTGANLINSPPDAISPLTGAQLVALKAKAYYCMCASNASSGNGGQWSLDPTSAATLVSTFVSPLSLYAISNSTPGNSAGTCNIYPNPSIPYDTWYNFASGHCASGTDVRFFWDLLSTDLVNLFPSWFGLSPSGTFTYTPGSNSYTWAASSAQQYYSTGYTIDTITLVSFVSSIEWSDPAFFSPR